VHVHVPAAGRISHHTTKSSGILKYTVTWWRWSDKSPRRSLLAEYLVPLSPAVSLQSMHAATQGQDRTNCLWPPSLPLELDLGMWEPSVPGGKIEAILFVVQLCTFIFEARAQRLDKTFLACIFDSYYHPNHVTACSVQNNNHLNSFCTYSSNEFPSNCVIIIIIIIISSNYKRRIILLMNRSTNIF
jgi:hypothetical protein